MSNSMKTTADSAFCAGSPENGSGRERVDAGTGIHEECGIFGIYDLDGKSVNHRIFYALEALQHRGQESCGIACTDTQGTRGNVNYHKGIGLLSEVFKEEETLNKLTGNLGIGHVRYSTSGQISVTNAQPLVINYLKGSLVLAHNGNLVNALELRSEMENSGAIFHTSIDSEVIAYCLVQERVRSQTIEEAVRNAMKRIRGAYALVIMSPRKLIGVRDPYGIRPLVLGKKGNAYMFASESCALYSIGAEVLRDVQPGEIVTIDQDGQIYSQLMENAVPREKQAHCIFEYIYFARLDSKIDKISVYQARIRGGASLARRYPVDADIVCGVPDSGLAAAEGYSMESGIPFVMALHKNSYIGRTFIKPDQSERETSVKMKLSVIAPVIKGKRVVLVDDSIVRGTTIANLIRTMKTCGATQVHVRISSPPFQHPCYFGVNVPSNQQLVASHHSTEEIREMIGADSLGYMPIEELQSMVGDLPICKGCFDGAYPIDVPGYDIHNQLESQSDFV